VTLPKQDTSVTLTLTLTYNGREDLTVSRVYTVDVKRDTTPRELDYQALLEAALTEYGLHDPQDSTSIDTASVTSDIQFPTTRQLNTATITRTSTASTRPSCSARATTA